jgi:flavin reductase (DIM6/NTAB) family NADH-FMN oxidoreductase RutF
MTNAPSPLQEAMLAGLRRLAKAVVVITCAPEGKRYAMAATAVSELSMEPPSLLICVNKSASISVPLSQRIDFAVNILHSSHEPLSILCSGAIKGEERFKLGDWRQGRTGVPVLADAQAVFECRHADHLTFGTHDIIVGEVFACAVSGELDPLVYVDKQYITVSSGLKHPEPRPRIPHHPR